MTRAPAIDPERLKSSTRDLTALLIAERQGWLMYAAAVDSEAVEPAARRYKVIRDGQMYTLYGREVLPFVFGLGLQAGKAELVTYRPDQVAGASA